MKFDPHTDNRYLGFTFDTQTGINVLTDLLRLGRKKVSVQLMLSFALSKIEHRHEKLEKMKVLKESCSIIGVGAFARTLGVSRQTVYNWRDAGYLICKKDGKIDLEETVALWEAIDSWVE